jgi:hypothetical protein
MSTRKKPAPGAAAQPGQAGGNASRSAQEKKKRSGGGHHPPAQQQNPEMRALTSVVNACSNLTREQCVRIFGYACAEKNITLPWLLGEYQRTMSGFQQQQNWLEGGAVGGASAMETSAGAGNTRTAGAAG